MTEEDNRQKFYSKLQEMTDTINYLKDFYDVEMNGKSYEAKQIQKLQQDIIFISDQKDIFQSDLENEKALRKALETQLEMSERNRSDLLTRHMDILFEYETMSIFSFLKVKWNKWLAN